MDSFPRKKISSLPPDQPKADANGAIAYFRETAVAYDQDPYLRYVYAARERKVLELLPPGAPRLLDWGCGTGRLYLLVADRCSAYLGVDPAAEMLARSPLGPHNSWCGLLEDCPAQPGTWDVVVALGLIPYLSAADLSLGLQRVGELLRPGGRLLLSFDHAGAWQNRLRPFLQTVLPSRPAGNKLLTRDIQLATQLPTDWPEILPPALRVRAVHPLPAGVPFLHHLSPRLAMAASRLLPATGVDYLRWTLLLEAERVLP